VPALLALLLWMFARPREVLPSAGEGPVRHFFGNRRGWLLAVYFGLINGGYTSMVAWLPVYYRQLGWSAQDSGGLVGIMTIFQVLAALSVPLLIRRRLDRRPWLLAALLVQLGGFCGLLLMPLQHAALWVALIGYGLGACFALSLTLTLDHLHEPRAAGSLAAFVQGIGFIITGIVPYLTGWLRDATGSFQASWLLLAASVVAMLLVTLRFAPSGYARAMGETRD
ncbi:MFS transporter, partial [Pseudomonas aeruginosa]|nr:MFS transporter [Pseudomonas aeruginosa]